MLAPRRAAMPGEHDPRPALVVGALACMVLAMGPVRPLGNVYDALGHLVPGRAMVRAPGQIASGLQLVFSVLVGFGVAALVRVSPIRWRLAAGAALVAVGTAGTLMIGYRGSEAPIVYSAHLARPAEEGLAFHRELAALGGTGPILDLPLDTPELTYGPTPPITLAAHHGRRTTTCHGSYPSDQADEIHRLARQLDRRTSTRRLAAMGVTTIVVQLPTQPDEAARVQREILDRADANPAGLVPLLARGRFHAYRLRTDDGPLARP
jgi:hypothetical protein